MSDVRIGFVGVGSMGQMAHLRNYVNIDGCQVVALAELRPKTGRAVADRYGIACVYRDHREMLAAEQLDGVVASQPFATHFALLPELYGHVKHVFTEKPLAVSVAAGESLARAAAEADCVHMVGYHKRSDPATEHARTVIDEWTRTGRMGSLRYVRITMPPGDWIAGGFIGLLKKDDPTPELPVEPKPADMSDEIYKAYVSFVNYYIHQINLMRHLLGEPYKVMHVDKAGILLVVQSRSGVSGIIEMAPYQTTVEWQESALIAFDRGYIVLRLPAPLAVNRCGTVEVYSDPGDGVTPEHRQPVMPPIHAMRRQAENFVKVCRGEMAPPCDAAEAVEDLRVARDTIQMRYEGV